MRDEELHGALAMEGGEASRLANRFAVVSGKVGTWMQDDLWKFAFFVWLLLYAQVLIHWL